MTTIAHHPAPESLMSCSAGSMSEAFAAVMAGHISVCPACRSELAVMERIGAALFEAIDPTPTATSDPPLASMGRGQANVPQGSDPQIDAAPSGDVPAALVAKLGTSLDGVRWKYVGPGVWQHQIGLSRAGETTLRLIKVAPGRALPEHGHSGSELTLVLRGVFIDGDRRYGIGDVADRSEQDAHAPVSGTDGECICLVATDGKLRFKSRLARLMQPLLGF